MKYEKIIIPFFLIFLILFLIVFYYCRNKLDEKYDFQIYFFNAGKADAILLSKKDKYILIDTGEDDLQDEIIKYFKEHNITRLESLILTHFDKDHIGSASRIINEIDIGEIFQSNVSKDSEYYNAYLDAIENNKIEPKTITGDYKYNLDDLKIVINGPTIVFEKNESNNSSLIVSVTYKNNNFLFMGDSQNLRIKDFLNTNNTTYDFLKVPYHGKYLKRLDDLLKRNSFKDAVITSSLDNLESTETIELLKKYNINIYLTRNGSIRVLSDGTSIKIRQ